MTPEVVIDVFQNTLWVLVLLVAILLMPALAVGLLIAVFQAATSINEMTLSFIPKLMIVGVALVVAGPWMLTTFISFTRELYLNIPAMIG